MRGLRVGTLIGLLAVAATAGTASANHGTCARAGGLVVQQFGPTGADVCVLVNADGVRVGADAINNCTFTGGCTTVGAHVEIVGGRPAACVGSALNTVPLLIVCPV